MRLPIDKAAARSSSNVNSSISSITAGAAIRVLSGWSGNSALIMRCIVSGSRGGSRETPISRRGDYLVTQSPSVPVNILPYVLPAAFLAFLDCHQETQVSVVSWRSDNNLEPVMSPFDTFCAGLSSAGPGFCAAARQFHRTISTPAYHASSVLVWAWKHRMPWRSSDRCLSEGLGVRSCGHSTRFPLAAKVTRSIQGVDKS